MRAVCSGTRGRGCCSWSDMAKPPEITAPTPLSTFRLTHSPTVSGQHAGQLHFISIEEGNHAIVQQIGCGERGLAIGEFGEGHLGRGVDERLLVDASDPLQGADVERVLRPTVAGHSLSNSPWASLSVRAFSKAASWPSVRTKPSCATLASSALRRFFIVSRSWRCHTPRTISGAVRFASRGLRRVSS